MALIKRLVKGSKITPAENDDNLDWLNEGGTSTSSTIYLNRASGWSHRATGINPLTGALTIDLTGVVESGWAQAYWTSTDGSWPTVTVNNGTGKGIAGADITAITKTIGTLPGAGSYNIGFDYINGVLSMWSVDASGTSSAGDTTAPTVSSFTIANVNPDLATIVFSEAVTFPDVTGLSMDGDFADVTLSNPQGSGTTWTLDLSRAAVNGEIGNFVYGATNTIKDTASTPNALVAGSTGVINQVAIIPNYAINFDLSTRDTIRKTMSTGFFTTDFTIEFIVDNYTWVTGRYLFCYGANNSAPGVIYLYAGTSSTNNTVSFVGGDGTKYNTIIGTIVAGDKIKITRTGNDFKVYLNDSEVGTTKTITDYVEPSSKVMTIGGLIYDASTYFTTWGITAFKLNSETFDFAEQTGSSTTGSSGSVFTLNSVLGNIEDMWSVAS